jgi:hypothetical protein
MKKLIFLIMTGCVLLSFIFYSCSKDFLTTQPLGQANNVGLQNKAGVDALLIGCYHSLLGFGSNPGWWNVSPWAASPTNWWYGGVASDDATKGSSISDQATIVPIEDYTVGPSNNDYVWGKWGETYDGVVRCNDVLNILPGASDMTAAEKTAVQAQVLFIRGWLYFELKRTFNNIAFFTEKDDAKTVKNNVDAWPMIETDLQFAVDNLPETQGSDVGRATKYAAMAVLGRVKLFQAKQTPAKYDEAIALFDAIINSNKYTLVQNFDENYLIATRNNSESIFEIQYAVNDGTPESANGGYADGLNFPANVDGASVCCGFYQPTQNLVNAFKVDATGLPLFDTFNASNFTNDMGLKSGDLFVQDTVTPVDPRLDMTVGRRGVPYLDHGIMRGDNWIRDQGNAGPYLNKKNMFKKADAGNVTSVGWQPVSANNYRAYTLTHVLLWRAECAVEKNDLAKALTLVNQVRARAANPAHWVKGRCRTFSLPSQNGLSVDNTLYAANYQIGQYPSFASQAYARTAVQWEIRLEKAMEGQRHFDLVRWGIAATTINAYMVADRSFRGLFAGVKPKSFTAGKNEYLPIPQTEIDLEPGVLTQNPGY